jgi:hypothetical protein
MREDLERRLERLLDRLEIVGTYMSQLADVVAAEVAEDNAAITALNELAAKVAAGTANVGDAQAAIAALQASQANLAAAIAQDDPPTTDPAPDPTPDPTPDPSTDPSTDPTAGTTGQNAPPVGSDLPSQPSA